MKTVLSFATYLFLAVAGIAADRVELVKTLARSGENPAGKLLIASDGRYYGTAKRGGTNELGCIYRFDSATGQITTVASFGSNTGKFPNGELLDGGDGFLYGTAMRGGGGSSDFGTVFRMKVSDGSLVKLAQFDGVNSGKFPLGGLVKVGSRFYGVASDGGASNCGTVFKVTPVVGTTNWDIGAYATFDGANGKTPWGTLVDAGSGVLMGTTEVGGVADKGCIFKVATTGAQARTIQVLREFAGGTGDGANPRAGFWKSKADGLFYGTTFAGGVDGFGTVFRIASSGAGFQLVASMESAKGIRPQGPVVEPPVGDDFLYGTCSDGGVNGAGAVFKVRRDNNGAAILPENVASFDTADGETPLSGLVFGPDGLAYGAAEQGGQGGLGTVFRVTTTIALRSEASFISTEGSNPRTALSAGADGTLYGTTFDGGVTGAGGVFRIAPDGSFSTITNFTGPDGAHPLAPLVVLADGTLFGTTYNGGNNSGHGTFFRVTADGTVQPLILFGGNTAPKGENPRGALVHSGDVFFGTTEKGGASNKGTIFKITVNAPGALPPAVLSTLHEFTGTNGDGELPYGGLVDGGGGFFYGTTTKGGTGGYGTFFKINSVGNYTKIADFANANRYPLSTLVKDSGGPTFYGVSDPSIFENTPPDAGSVYKITAAGALTTLHQFTGTSALPAEGYAPRGLAQVASDRLAGVTYGAGGTLFTIGTSPEVPTTIYRFNVNFSGDLKAARPEASPFLAPDSAIYGTTQKSIGGGGAIFRLLTTAPGAITSVTETTPDAAIARGVINPNGETVDVFFEYSTSPSFTPLTATAHQSFSGTVSQTVAADLSGLTPSTTYYVRMKVGIRPSLTFIYGAPAVTTGAASGVGARVATLRGAVDPSGRDTSVEIQYGTTIAYGTTISLNSIGRGSDPIVVETALAELTPETTYHYRVVATNAVATTEGSDGIFTTGQNSAPVAPALQGLSTSLTKSVLIPVPADLDPDDDTVTISIDRQPSFGVAIVEGANAIRYTPTAGFRGSDTFTYAVTDTSFARTVGNVTIRNPFAALKGSYLTYLTNAQGEPTGSLSLSVNSVGSFTGKGSFGGSFAVKGIFDPATGTRSGTASITVKRAGKPPLVIVLRLDTLSPLGVLSGTVGDQIIVDDSRLATTKTAPQAGRGPTSARVCACRPACAPGRGRGRVRASPAAAVWRPSARPSRGRLCWPRPAASPAAGSRA